MNDQPAACSVSVASLDFGSVAAGQTVTRQFTIQNTGGGTLTGVAHAGCSAFWLLDSTFSLPAGAIGTIRVGFKWRAPGLEQCSIATGTSNCGAIQCTATALTSPCGVTPTALPFGHVLLGSNSSLQFTVTNNGSQAMTAIPSSSNAAFSVSPGNGWYLQPGQSAPFAVTFAPSQAGAQSSDITLSDICGTVTCTGTGDPAPCFVSPTTLNFGSVDFGWFANKTFTIRNDGTTRLVGSVTNTISGDCASFFVLEDPQYDLAPGESKSLTLRCQPRRLVSQISCELSTGTAPCTQIHCLATVKSPEAGTCASAGFQGPVELDFGDVPIGQTVTRTVHFWALDTCTWPWPTAWVALELLGPDFALSDGSQFENLRPPIDANITIRFTPTAEGEQSLAVRSWRACNADGNGFPCSVVYGRGNGVAMPGASSRLGHASWHQRPLPWQPRAR